MFIVIEGLDGSGKSTQVRLLEQYMEEVFPPVDYIHFPRYDAPVYGELISRFLRGEFGSKEAVHPQLVALLFAEDRHGAGPEIRQTLQQGGSVLLDRYVYSNIAYQCAKLSDPLEAQRLRDWIFNTEYGDFNLPKPDLNIFLDVPIEFVKQRLSHQRGGGDRAYLEGRSDIHEADIEFQKKVREIYLEQCRLDPSFLRVDCSAPDGSMLEAAQVFEKIVKLLKSKI